MPVIKLISEKLERGGSEVVRDQAIQKTMGSIGRTHAPPKCTMYTKCTKQSSPQQGENCEIQTTY